MGNAGPICYGAAFAALAIGSAPASLGASDDAEERIRALARYLQLDVERQPMHVRLMTLWGIDQTSAGHDGGGAAVHG